MRAWSLVALLATTLFAGCAAPPEEPLTNDHPANPAAAEAPPAPASETLARPSREDRVAPAEVPAAPDSQNHQHAGGADAGTTTQFTCPHHPEVVSAEPGDCPKCGMKLQRRSAPASAGGATPQHDHGGHGAPHGGQSGHGGHR